jgi:hypothetical protein
METKETRVDQVLECVDCGREFVYSAGEQRFFESKNPPLRPPRRCIDCRRRRRLSIDPPDKVVSNAK